MQDDQAASFRPNQLIAEVKHQGLNDVYDDDKNEDDCDDCNDAEADESHETRLCLRDAELHAGSNTGKGITELCVSFDFAADIHANTCACDKSSASLFVQLKQT